MMNTKRAFASLVAGAVMGSTILACVPEGAQSQLDRASHRRQQKKNEWRNIGIGSRPRAPRQILPAPPQPSPSKIDFGIGSGRVERPGHSYFHSLKQEPISTPTASPHADAPVAAPQFGPQMYPRFRLYLTPYGEWRTGV